ncbi:MAG: 3-deoxy-7-phosphoheptulonate synthase [Deltaproteobacteria bacterium]|nr:3-deoxy-7-phosphoheptulonate synthase [Deltaproteobacteria bacterium]
MIITLDPTASAEQIEELLRRFRRVGLSPAHEPGTQRVVVGTNDDELVAARLGLRGDPCIRSVATDALACPLVSRARRPEGSVVRIGTAGVGGERFLLVAGPCAVESLEQMRHSAQAVRRAGAHVLRGGAFKSRTSPYSFPGLGRDGLAILRQVGDEIGLPTLTEVVEVADVGAVAARADALQVGARNMYNARLLAALGRCGRPVVLKRGMAASVEDLLLAAERLALAGNEEIVLCESGIRTFETATRNTLDLCAVPWLKSRSHLPVLVDPSHGTGRRELVAPMARAAAACGADGIMVEVHPDPDQALSDGEQALTPAEFEALVRGLAPVVAAVGRTL